MAFLTLSGAQLFAALGFQNLHGSLFRIRPKEHPYLWLSFLGSLALQLVVVLIPPLRSLFGLASLSLPAYLAAAALSFAMLLLVEGYKALLARLGK